VKKFLANVKNPIKKVILYLILVGIIFFSVSLFSKPIRIKWSNNYIDSGDNLLYQKKYLEADLEYRKALTLFWKNRKAISRRILAKEAQTDVTRLIDFFRETNRTEKLESFNSDLAVPQGSLEIVKKCRQLLEKGEKQSAVVLAEKATRADINNRDAWLYLGIASLEVSKTVQLEPEIKSVYIEKAKTALLKARSLDPENETIRDLLSSLN